MIIHIDGVQGSGKSYICSKLKYIKCIDTDDINKEAINIIEKSQNTKNKMPRTFNQLKKVIKILVNKYIQENNKIVFVGMTAEIPNPDYKYFIKITDFVGVYKRLLLRELNKIVKHEKDIIKHIEQEKDPREIDIDRVADLSLRFPFDFIAFKTDYQERLKQAKSKKYIIKTQEELIKVINNL